MLNSKIRIHDFGSSPIVQSLRSMKVVQEMISAALHMRELALDAKLPGYAEKMLHAAKELEHQACAPSEEYAGELDRRWNSTPLAIVESQP